MVVAQVTDTAVVQLQQVKEILRRYCQGLTARGIQIYATKDLTERGIGWSSVEQPATEGTSIFLPTSIDEYATADHNFAHYKVLATHQAAHLEFGTFDFGFARSAFLFGDTRQEIRQRAGSDGKSFTDFQRFFDLFPDRKLASDLFTIVEDTRIDYLLKHEYRGILGAYERAQQGALTKRPEVSSLPIREALLEVLVQVSIENWGFFPVPAGQSARLAEAVAILRRVRNRRATVEDCAEATIRIYNILSQTENFNARSPDSQSWDSANPLAGDYAPSEEDLERMVSDFIGQNDSQGGSNGSGNPSQKQRREEPYRSPRPIDYRGGIKPELVQTIKRISQNQQRPPANVQSPCGQDKRQTLQELLGKSVEIEISDAKASGQDASQAITMNLLKREPGLADGAGGESDGNTKEDGPLLSIARPGLPASEDGAFLYDEWDYLRNEYKRHWCQLRQRSLGEGSGEFYADTLKTYSGLVTGVRREFERFRNQRFKKVRRLPDGDEFDLDSVIEAVVEKRAGVAPSDKLYWRKNKVERDVGVALLLDMSASTYESVSGGYKLSSYMPRMDEDGAERGKRIIDIEKESIVILVEALEAIGDAYGIYCFSGHGKNNVEFYVVKDMAEDLTAGVKKRIAKIAPAQETRMGTAIRHASLLLENQEYKTKILLLLSDGRPQDHDYGAHHFRNIDGLDPSASASYFSKPSNSYDRFMKDYAVYDTRIALLEARRRDITPFCLTVDRRGHDYLKAMCGDIGYEIIDDITSLPKRLPSLYRRLTT